MKDSEQLRAMGQYIRNYGFSPYYGDDGGPRCFIGARYSAVDIVTDTISNIGTGVLLRDVLGDNFLGEDELIEAGFSGPEATDDAYAACMIAADICEAEGR